MQLESRISFPGIVSVFRVVCLLLTLVSLLTVYFWVYQQDVVNSIDEQLSNPYFAQYQSQLKQVNQLFKTGQYDAAAAHAENALSEMEYIRSRDKNYKIKRRVLLRLVQSKLHLGAPHAAEVLPYAESWARSNERDISAWRAYIQVLKEVPGKDEDLQDALMLFQARFPGRTSALAGID